MSDEFADCGLDGDPNAPVKIGPFNKLIQRAGRAHLKPIKNHIESCEKLQAKISGGITVLLFMVPIATIVLGGLALSISKRWFGL